MTKKRFIRLFHWTTYSQNAPIHHFPIKRLFDLGFSLLMILILSPLFLLIALAIALSSKGPVFYAHERISRGGCSFKFYKFRSMYQDSNQRLKEILSSDPTRKKEWQTTHKLKNDPRVTPIGNFLRKTSLDELPQFWNVLKGDLSIVGPRPVMQEELHQHFKEKTKKILSIRPGLTGIWQTSGRSDLSYATRIAMDEEYVDDVSLRKDIKLILKTVPTMLFSKGAY